MQEYILNSLSLFIELLTNILVKCSKVKIITTSHMNFEIPEIQSRTFLLKNLDTDEALNLFLDMANLNV